VRCSMLQHVAACCSMLQCVAVSVTVCCGVVKCVSAFSVGCSARCSVCSPRVELLICNKHWRLHTCVVMCVSVCCSVLQCMLQCVMQCVAACMSRALPPQQTLASAHVWRSVCCSVLQSVCCSVWYSVLQCLAACCTSKALLLQQTLAPATKTGACICVLQCVGGAFQYAAV